MHDINTLIKKIRKSLISIVCSNKRMYALDWNVIHYIGLISPFVIAFEILISYKSRLITIFLCSYKWTVPVKYYDQASASIRLQIFDRNSGKE